MPLYDIQHSVPLTKPQKQQLADKITHLHATTFTTPSLFVNMQFTSLDPSDGNYFIAGKPRPEGYNRITGMVRTSESRTKKDFDNIAEKIEQIWDEVVRGIDPENEKEKEGDDKNKKKNEESESEREAKKLRAVFLYPMVAARENGVVIPTAGEEGQWLKSNMKDFKYRAETKGDEDFVQMMEELDTRDDLKKMLK